MGQKLMMLSMVDPKLMNIVGKRSVLPIVSLSCYAQPG